MDISGIPQEKWLEGRIVPNGDTPPQRPQKPLGPKQSLIVAITIILATIYFPFGLMVALVIDVIIYLFILADRQRPRF